VYNAKPITKSHLEMLRSSRWSVIMLPEPFPSLDERLPEEMETMLDKLMQCAASPVTSASESEVYISSIHSLKYTLILMSSRRPPQVSISIFAVMVPGQYWDMVKKRDPLALAILANYAVTLYWMRTSIWMEGWGKDIVDAVREALTPEWKHCISWAIKETIRVQ
jgi:hypothetical protein